MPEFLREIDIITPNKVEAEMLTGINVTDEQSMHAITNEFFRFGVRNVLITLGSNGVFVGLPDRTALIPGFKVRSIDSTGAGDVVQRIACRIHCRRDVRRGRGQDGECFGSDLRNTDGGAELGTAQNGNRKFHRIERVMRLRCA